MKPKPARKMSPPGKPPAVAVATLEPEPRPDPARRLQWLFAAAIVAVGFVIYFRALSGPFLFDDADMWEALSPVRSKHWRLILSTPRPLLTVTFALNDWLTGPNPFYFHLVSIALHVINALILWQLVQRLCALPALTQALPPPARSLITLAVPLLFLTSPIQTESVGYISSRSELLAATPYLAAMLVFVSSWRESRPWLTAALIAVLYGCSVTSKQHGLTLPGAILLLDYFFLAGRDWRQLRRNWPTYLLLGLEMLVGGFIVVGAVIRVPSAGFFLRGVTWKSYLFTQFRMYWFYLRLLLVPIGLNVDHDINPSRSLLDHGSWLALGGLLFVVSAAWRFRHRAPVVAFGALFYLMTLFPTSSFFPLLDYAAERRLYLPAIGFFLAVTALIAQRWGATHWLRAAVVVVIMLYAVGTHARNRVWEDSLALWQDVVQKSPLKWRAHNNVGYEYSQRKRFEEATRAFQRAAELVPQKSREHAQVLTSLGSAYANRKMYTEAARTYRQALHITPEISNLWTNLAVTEIRLGREDAWQYFEKAIEADPLSWVPHYARGGLYFERGRYDEAIRDYRRALQLSPENADAQHNLQVALAARASQNR